MALNPDRRFLFHVKTCQLDSTGEAFWERREGGFFHFTLDFTQIQLHDRGVFANMAKPRRYEGNNHGNLAISADFFRKFANGKAVLAPDIVDCFFAMEGSEEDHSHDIRDVAVRFNRLSFIEKRDFFLREGFSNEITHYALVGEGEAGTVDRKSTRLNS